MERLQIKDYGIAFLFGTLIWSIPFFSSFFFFNTQGELLLDQYFFESVMTIILVLVLMIFTVLYLRKRALSATQILIIAGMWFGLSVLYDFLILVPIAGLTILDWSLRIGARYLIIPVVLGALALLTHLKK